MLGSIVEVSDKVSVCVSHPRSNFLIGNLFDYDVVTKHALLSSKCTSGSVSLLHSERFVAFHAVVTYSHVDGLFLDSLMDFICYCFHHKTQRTNIGGKALRNAVVIIMQPLSQLHAIGFVTSSQLEFLMSVLLHVSLHFS